MRSSRSAPRQRGSMARDATARAYGKCATMRSSVSSGTRPNVWRRRERCQYRGRAVVHRLAQRVKVDRARLERRIAELSAIGGSGTSVTRLGLSPEEQAARDLVGGWLAARGATVRRDAAA